MGRVICTGILLGLVAGCATTPPPVSEPVPVKEYVVPDIPPWVFEKFPEADGQTVRERGGTNLAQYHVLREQSAFVGACNVRLGRVESILNEFHQRHRSRNEPDED